MNNIINWFTKKKSAYVSFAMIVVYIISYFHQFFGLPVFYKNFCCVDDRKLNLFFIFIPIFIFSLFFLKLSDFKFERWKKFTLLYLIIYLVIYFLSPTQGNGYVWFQRETISLFGFITYTALSLYLSKSFKKEVSTKS
jgi:hypothetical protein